MFLVDDAISAALGYLKERLLDRQRSTKEAVAHARKAMRKLAASLSEVVEYLDGGVHKLERSVGDPSTFFDELAELVDAERLQSNCSEAGVCEDLRVAQNELWEVSKNLPAGSGGDAVAQLTSQMDGYEREFVAAVREFLADARGHDLTAASAGGGVDTGEVLGALRERVGALRDVVGTIEGLCGQLRDASLGTWVSPADRSAN